MLSLKNKIINLSLIDYHTKNQNVALLAFGSLLEGKSENHILDQTYLEDMKMGLELFLYDLQSIDALLSENMDYFMEHLEKIEPSATATKEQKEHTLCIEEYINSQNVALLALVGTQSNDNQDILSFECKEDLTGGVELLIFNLKSIYDNMLGNMEHLWEIKDKIATKRRELGIYPIFSFKQREDPREPHNQELPTPQEIQI